MERARVASIRTPLAVAALLAAVGGCSDSPGSSTCATDQDGVSGGSYTFELTVTDTGFSPTILSSQNAAQVKLTLKNAGTRPHDFVVDCLTTPNSTGCPTTTCFPHGASLAAVAPGASATTSFVTPSDGLYVFRSDVGSDSHVAADGGVTGLAGQYNVQ